MVNFERTPRVHGEHSWPIVGRIRLLLFVLFRMSHSSSFGNNSDGSYKHLKSVLHVSDKIDHMCVFF
jgi:hypothetical protein